MPAGKGAFPNSEKTLDNKKRQYNGKLPKTVILSLSCHSVLVLLAFEHNKIETIVFKGN